MGCGQSTRSDRETTSTPAELQGVMPTATSTPREEVVPPISNLNEQPQFFALVQKSSSSKDLGCSKIRKEEDLSSICSSQRTEEVGKMVGSASRIGSSSTTSSSILVGAMGKVPIMSRVETLADWLAHVATPDPGVVMENPIHSYIEDDDGDCDPVEELYHLNSATGSVSSAFPVFPSRSHDHHGVTRFDDATFSDDETPAQEERMKNMNEVVSSAGSENEWMYQLQRLEENYRRQHGEHAPVSQQTDVHTDAPPTSQA